MTASCYKNHQSLVLCSYLAGSCPEPDQPTREVGPPEIHGSEARKAADPSRRTRHSARAPARPASGMGREVRQVLPENRGCIRRNGRSRPDLGTRQGPAGGLP